MKSYSLKVKFSLIIVVIFYAFVSQAMPGMGGVAGGVSPRSILPLAAQNKAAFSCHVVFKSAAEQAIYQQDHYTLPVITSNQLDVFRWIVSPQEGRDFEGPVVMRGLFPRADQLANTNNRIVKLNAVPGDAVVVGTATMQRSNEIKTENYNSRPLSYFEVSDIVYLPQNKLAYVIVSTEGDVYSLNRFSYVDVEGPKPNYILQETPITFLDASVVRFTLDDIRSKDIVARSIGFATVTETKTSTRASWRISYEVAEINTFTNARPLSIVTLGDLVRSSLTDNQLWGVVEKDFSEITLREVISGKNGLELSSNIQVIKFDSNSTDGYLNSNHLVSVGTFERKREEKIVDVSLTSNKLSSKEKRASELDVGSVLRIMHKGQSIKTQPSWMVVNKEKTQLTLIKLKKDGTFNPEGTTKTIPSDQAVFYEGKLRVIED